MEAADPRRNLYGRRSSRTLRPAQAARFETLLPHLAVVPEPGQTLALEQVFHRAYAGYALEIGFGGGEHLVAQARTNPDCGYLGAEFYRNGVAAALHQCELAGLTEASANLRLHMGDVRVLMDALPEASLDAAYILFPDPWPKARQWRRRMVSAETLARLAKLLKPGGCLRLASDHPDYQPWMLRILLDSPDFIWQPKGADSWRNRATDWPETRYERKARREGRPCLYLEARRRGG